MFRSLAERVAGETDPEIIEKILIGGLVSLEPMDQPIKGIKICVPYLRDYRDVVRSTLTSLKAVLKQVYGVEVDL